jgi:(p)ppGpp synthase/HD superfamily hydrolase
VNAQLTERFDLALAYANALHRGDLRKHAEIPAIAHLMGVCSLVLENGGNEMEAIAALLHDAAEEHGGAAQVAQIATYFGEDVARIVQECSDSLDDGSRGQKAPWFDRKTAYIAQLRALAPARPSTALVACADKFYNLRAIDDGLRRPGGGEAVFERFEGKKLGTLWYYRELADVFGAFDGRHAFMAGELAALADRLSGARPARTLLEAYRASGDEAAPEAVS